MVCLARVCKHVVVMETSGSPVSTHQTLHHDPLNIATETIHQDLHQQHQLHHHHHHHLESDGDMDDDDEDDDILSSTGSPCYDDDDGLITSGMTPDEVTAQLAAAGPVGVAAAAAIASAKKRKRPHSFETNPSIRKRQQTRLMRKIKQTIDEYTTRVGQQAVVMFVTPGKPQNCYKVFGAKPLEDVMRALRLPVMQELETALSRHAPPPVQEDPSRHELPPLVIDGIPTPVEKMTQAQLRAFIPLMLKFSTGKGKPGWGKAYARPEWWPNEVPWANVRRDYRSHSVKEKVSWTHALRQIVINCYRFHGRDDLLPAFIEDDEMKSAGAGGGGGVGSLTADDAAGTDECDNGDECFTVGGASGVSSLTAADTFSVAAHTGQVVAEEGGGRHCSVKLETHQTAPSQYTQAVAHALNGHDNTVSIIHVDPNNPLITLADGTQAQLQNVSTTDDVQSSTQTMNIDLSSVAEASINADGQLVLSGVAEHTFAGGGIVTIPISSSMYQTVMASVQHVQSADGQTLQVALDSPGSVTIGNKMAAVGVVDNSTSTVDQLPKHMTE